MTIQTPTLHGLFPCPVYIVNRDSNLSPKENKDIEDIIEEGMSRNTSNSLSINSYIFNSKLKEIKQFCEEHIKNYVDKILNPKEELDFYITQSWLNVTEPGEFHHEHSHQNAIISGVFYISTGENDKITFSDPNQKIKELILVKPKEYSIWNSGAWFFSVNNNELVLFPTWLSHKVVPNEEATTDRISLAFNVFARGNLGNQKNTNELIIK